MTLSYCSFNCCSSASRINERCCRIEKVPRIPQATATVSEMARISRAEIDRSLNMRDTDAPQEEDSDSPRNCLRRDYGISRLQRRASPPALGRRSTRDGAGGQDHPADVLVMGVPALDLLRDGVHVAKPALEF